MTLYFPRLPGVLAPIEDFLVGHWPEGDEDKMRDAAASWKKMADALRELQAPADAQMNQALAAIDGKTHDAMQSWWQDVAGGDGSDLASLIKACDSFHDQFISGARDIEHTKLSIYISVGIMVANLVWMLIPGVGEAEEAAVLAAGKLAIQNVFKNLLKKLGIDAAKFMERRGAKLLVSAATGALMNAGTDLGAQGIQLAMGTRDLGDMDMKSVGLSALGGGLAGGVGGLTGGALTEGLTSSLGPSGRIATGLVNAAGEIGGNFLGNAASTAGTQLATGQQVDISDSWQGAGAALGALDGSHGNPDVPHSETPHPETAPPGETAAPASGTPEHPAATAPQADSPAPQTAAPGPQTEAPAPQTDHPAAQPEAPAAPENQNPSAAAPPVAPESAPAPTDPASTAPQGDTVTTSGHPATPSDAPTGNTTPDLSGRPSTTDPGMPVGNRDLGAAPADPPAGAPAPQSAPAAPQSAPAAPDRGIGGTPGTPAADRGVLAPAAPGSTAPAPDRPTTTTPGGPAPADRGTTAAPTSPAPAPDRAVPTAQNRDPASPSTPGSDRPAGPATPGSDRPAGPATPGSDRPAGLATPGSDRPASPAAPAGDRPSDSSRPGPDRPAGPGTPGADRPLQSTGESHPPASDPARQAPTAPPRQPVHAQQPPIAPGHPGGRPSHPHTPPHPPHQQTPAAHPAHPAPRPAQQRAQNARSARENLRAAPGTPERPVRPIGKPEPAYNIRHVDTPAGPLTVATVKVHVTHDDSITHNQLDTLWNRGQLATDLHFNTGHTLPDGTRIVVDVLHTPNPADAHLTWHVGDTPDANLHPTAGLGDLTDNLRDHLGLTPDTTATGVTPHDLDTLHNDLSRAPDNPVTHPGDHPQDHNRPAGTQPSDNPQPAGAHPRSDDPNPNQPHGDQPQQPSGTDHETGNRPDDSQQAPQPPAPDHPETGRPATQPESPGHPSDAGRPSDIGRPDDAGRPSDIGRPSDADHPSDADRPSDTGLSSDTQRATDEPGRPTDPDHPAPQEHPSDQPTEDTEPPNDPEHPDDTGSPRENQHPDDDRPGELEPGAPDTPHESDEVAVAGHDDDLPSLPDDDYFDSAGRPVETDDLVHPNMDPAELARLKAIENRLRSEDADYHAQHGKWPDPDPGVGPGHPAVDALLPPGYDPDHGLGRDGRLASITKPDGSLDWADGSLHPQGFDTPVDRHPVVLKPGDIIDRFGGTNGKFTSPPEVSFPERALPPTNLDGAQYHQYEILRELPVWQGGIAPQMGEPGKGIQHYLPTTVKALIEAGYLREVPPEESASKSGHANDDGHGSEFPAHAGPGDQDNTTPSPQSFPLAGRPGFSIMDPADNFYHNAKNVKPLPDHYDVVAHGTPNGMEMSSRGNKLLSARTMADMIRHRPDYQPGQPVRLLSCNTGHMDGSFARELSQALGTTVLAPDGYLYSNDRGHMGINPKIISVRYWAVRNMTGGTFHRYHPDGNVESLTRSEWEG